MLSIQQAGMEILGNSPRSLYFFCGREYGVKKKYVDHLETMYGKVVDVDSLDDLFASFRRKSLVSSKNSLYVSYYDTDFVRSVDSVHMKDILSLHLKGIVIAFYEDDKSFNKLDKLFPDNVVRFDNIPIQFVCKYLRSDFPELDDKYISLAANYCTSGYGQAKIVCSQMNSIRQHLHRMEDKDLLRTLGLEKDITEDVMIRYVAARNSAGVMSVVDSYEGDLQNLINGMCHVAIELDKAMDSKNNTPFSEYVRYWTREDVYNYFEQSYTQILKLRSETGGNAYRCLVYLSSLLKFKVIPSVKEIG